MSLLETLGQDQLASGLDRSVSPRHLYKEAASPGCFSKENKHQIVLESRVRIARKERNKHRRRERKERDGKARCSLHVRHGIAPRGLCIHATTKCRGHRGVLRHERQQPAAAVDGDQHVQVVRHLVDAAVRAGPGRAASRGRHGHPRGGRRAQRRALQPGRQPRRRGVVGAQQHPGVPVRLLPLRLGGQRGGWRRDPEPGPRHGERARRAGGRGAGPHQGDDVGVAGHPGRVQPAVGGRVHRRGGGVHGPGAGVPGPHGGPAHGQHLPVPGVGVQPERHGHELRAVHGVGNRGERRRRRVPEPVRHHRGRVLLRHGEARRQRRPARRVGERVAVRRRRAGQPDQRQDLQPVPDQPCGTRDAAPPGRHRDVPLLHVQREPEGQRRGAELGALLPQHAARLPNQLQLIDRCMHGRLSSQPYVSVSQSVSHYA